MSGLEQEKVQIAIIPCEPAFETSPTWVEVPLLACPDNAGYQLELLAVGVIFVVLPVDGSNVVKADIEFVDDSDSDTVTNLASAFDFTVNGNSAMTARVYNSIWRGSQILDPGDTVNAEMDTTTPDTAGQGAAFVVEFRVLQRMAY
jgi:hypothetical protein